MYNSLFLVPDSFRPIFRPRLSGCQYRLSFFFKFPECLLGLALPLPSPQHSLTPLIYDNLNLSWSTCQVLTFNFFILEIRFFPAELLQNFSTLFFIRVLHIAVHVFIFRKQYEYLLPAKINGSIIYKVLFKDHIFLLT